MHKKMTKKDEAQQSSITHTYAQTWKPRLRLMMMLMMIVQITNFEWLYAMLCVPYNKKEVYYYAFHSIIYCCRKSDISWACLYVWIVHWFYLLKYNILLSVNIIISGIPQSKGMMLHFILLRSTNHYDGKNL